MSPRVSEPVNRCRSASPSDMKNGRSIPKGSDGSKMSNETGSLRLLLRGSEIDSSLGELPAPG